MTDPADELFTLPPQEFVAARNRLAKALRREGRRDEAAAVSKLRRPPASVWALNQLARGQPDEVAELLEVGAELPAAQQALLGGDAARFRQAVDRHRSLVRALAARGAELVAAGGVAATDQQGEISDDLRAASTIPEAREPFRQGRLADRPGALGEPETGLPGLGLTAAPGPAATRPPGGSGDDEAEREREQQRARRAELDRQLDEARQSLDQARSERERREDAVADLESSLERARRRLEEAQDRVTDLEHHLGGLEAERSRLGAG